MPLSYLRAILLQHIAKPSVAAALARASSSAGAVPATFQPNILGAGATSLDALLLSGLCGGAGLQADLLPAAVDAMKAEVLAWQAAEAASTSVAVGTSGGPGPGHWRSSVGGRLMPFGDGNGGNGISDVAASLIPLPPRAMLRPPIPREPPSMSPRDAPCSARDNLNGTRGDVGDITGGGNGNDANAASDSKSCVGRSLDEKRRDAGGGPAPGTSSELALTQPVVTLVASGRYRLSASGDDGLGGAGGNSGAVAMGGVTDLTGWGDPAQTSPPDSSTAGWPPPLPASPHTGLLSSRRAPPRPRARGGSGRSASWHPNAGSAGSLSGGEARSPGAGTASSDVLPPSVVLMADLARSISPLLACPTAAASVPARPPSRHPDDRSQAATSSQRCSTNADSASPDEACASHGTGMFHPSRERI